MAWQPCSLNRVSGVFVCVQPTLQGSAMVKINGSVALIRGSAGLPWGNPSNSTVH